MIQSFAMTRLLALWTIAFFAVSCASSRDSDYHSGSSGEKLVVTRDFQFTSGPSGVSPMQHSCIVPAGVYRSVGADSNGTYYAAPGPFHFHTRVNVDLRGGLYQRGNQIFTCSLSPEDAPAGVPPGVALIAKAYLGSKPHLWDEVPPEFRKYIVAR